MSSLYVPPSRSSAAAAEPAAADGTWNVFSSRKKFAPRAEFTDDAARAFGRRHDNDMPAPFSGSGAGSRSGGGRGGHYDTGAFGNRSGGSSVFTDEAASAFGKRAIKKPAAAEPFVPTGAPIVRSDSLGAHLAAFGLDVTSAPEKEWKQSALPRASAAPAPALTKEEMFPALGTPKTATKDEMFPALGSPKSAAGIPKSESKGSFKDILKKRMEQDAAEEAQRRADEQEKAKRAREDARMMSLASRVRYRGNGRAAVGVADYEEEEEDHYCEDDLDALAQYDKPQRNYFQHHPEDEGYYNDEPDCDEEAEQEEI